MVFRTDDLCNYLSLPCLAQRALPAPHVEVFGLHMADQVGFLTGGQRAQVALPLTTAGSRHVLEHRVFKL